MTIWGMTLWGWATVLVLWLFTTRHAYGYGVWRTKRMAAQVTVELLAEQSMRHATVQIERRDAHVTQDGAGNVQITASDDATVVEALLATLPPRATS